ncbi:hypothetical protein [Corynebacterium stationis]|uniref:hypothetical protein n=1 Tax=Corynebacterium stationis TaxID=1705 RepID=UPI00076F94A0|nr:hypothetical protein [Corynebacterium stationis]AMJ45132.1 hypothetical protein AW169_09860 [Corynebacterium stationis]AQX71586.1 hypothetical protein CA21670_09065 [Corynebacterium stationis]ASJ19269.1 hypothetical protein BA700_09860 [Corynebacterium stationis]HJG65285.1 DUF2190 domain-containing protein [Corynebacterium stationis]
MYRNQLQDIYNPGTDLTAVADEEITGRRFTRYAGAMHGSNIVVATATAGSATSGVSKFDAAANDLVGIARGASRIVTIDTETALQPGDAVEVGNNGKATSHTDGIIVGYAVDIAEANDIAKISLIS